MTKVQKKKAKQVIKSNKQKSMIIKQFNQLLNNPHDGLSYALEKVKQFRQNYTHSLALY